jgi:hypothetical protein
MTITEKRPTLRVSAFLHAVQAGDVSGYEICREVETLDLDERAQFIDGLMRALKLGASRR